MSKKLLLFAAAHGAEECVYVDPESVVFIRGYTTKSGLLTEIGLTTGPILTTTERPDRVALFVEYPELKP